MFIHWAWRYLRGRQRGRDPGAPSHRVRLNRSERWRRPGSHRSVQKYIKVDLKEEWAKHFRRRIYINACSWQLRLYLWQAMYSRQLKAVPVLGTIQRTNKDFMPHVSTIRPTDKDSHCSRHISEERATVVAIVQLADFTCSRHCTAEGQDSTQTHINCSIPSLQETKSFSYFLHSHKIENLDILNLLNWNELEHSSDSILGQHLSLCNCWG